MSEWDDQIRLYLLDLKVSGSPETTIATRRSLLQRMAREMEAQGRSPKDATRLALSEHLAAESGRRKGAGPATYYATLKAFWGWYAAEYGTQDPMARIPRPRSPVKRTEVLTDAQLKAIEKATAGTDFLSRRNRFLVTILAGTGIRRGELCAAKAGDFTEDWSVMRVTGKTGTRVVFLDAASRAALARYLMARARLARPGVDALMVSRSGRPLAAGAIDSVLKAIGRRAGVEGLHAHLMRHLWAHRCQAANLDLTSILSLGGWTTPQQLTERYGAALREERAIEAARRTPLRNGSL